MDTLHYCISTVLQTVPEEMSMQYSDVSLRMDCTPPEHTNVKGSSSETNCSYTGSNCGPWYYITEKGMQDSMTSNQTERLDAPSSLVLKLPPHSINRIS